MATELSSSNDHHRSSELAVVRSSVEESFNEVLESQKTLFHNQIDQFRDIVVKQCKLTGVNPLSQEMAAGAFSVTIGKRPRDLLNPKAVKHMQSVFSVKDVISKKDIREISALYGLTVTQVREFFGGQRSRLRKISRLSKEKAVKTNSINEPHDGTPFNADADVDSVIPIDPVPLSSIAPSSAEQTSSSSNQDEVLPGISEPDKHFVDNVFNMIRQEESFAGEIKLMQWILRIENPVVLCWFLEKGGLMILASWLSEATTEEQTNVVDVTLKVLCHLPLHKALPSHMAAILQAVNRLRFYRSSDISNRARLLLSRLSKIFAKMQSGKDPVRLNSSSVARQEIHHKRRRELDENGSWQPAIGLQDILVDAGGTAEDIRCMEPPQPLKLLTMSSDESNKKQNLGLNSTHNKSKRKVLLVEAPGQKTVSKSHQGSRAVRTSLWRPITADEIQKAKLREQYMQDKRGGSNGLTSQRQQKGKNEAQKRSLLLTNDLLSASEAYLRPKLESQKKAKVALKNSDERFETSSDDKKQQMIVSNGTLSDSKRVQVKWRMPPEIRIDPAWRVAAGENSKEADFQKSRIAREKETLYRTNADIPSDPKEPWDVEMDYDDTLTPEIPIETIPDLDVPAGPQTVDYENHETRAATSQNGNAGGEAVVAAAAEPDFELLAVLLKNPELIPALMSGQANGLSGNDIAKLLDTIKSSGGAAGMLNGFLGQVNTALPSPTPQRNIRVSIPSQTELQPSRPEVSLPSPTPSSDPAPAGWRSEASRNPLVTGPVQQPLSVPETRHSAQSLPTTVPYDHLPTTRSMVSPAVSHNQSPINHPSTYQTQTLATRDFPASSPTPQPLPPREPLHQQTTLRAHQHPPPYSSFHDPHSFHEPPYSYHDATSSAHEHWRTRQDLAPDPYPYQYQTNSSASVGGPREPSPLPGSSWRRGGTGYGEQAAVRGYQYPSTEADTRYSRGRGRGNGPNDWSGDRTGNRWYHDRR